MIVCITGLSLNLLRVYVTQSTVLSMYGRNPVILSHCTNGVAVFNANCKLPMVQIDIVMLCFGSYHPVIQRFAI